MKDFIAPRAYDTNVIIRAGNLRAMAVGNAFGLANAYLFAWAKHVVDEWTGESIDGPEITLTGYELDALCAALDQSEKNLLNTMIEELHAAWQERTGDLQGRYPNPPFVKKEHGISYMYFPTYSAVPIL